MIPQNPNQLGKPVEEVPKSAEVKALSVEEIARIKEQLQVPAPETSQASQVKVPTAIPTAETPVAEPKPSVSIANTPISELPFSPELEYEKAEKLESPFDAFNVKNDASKRYLAKLGVTVEEDTK